MTVRGALIESRLFRQVKDPIRQTFRKLGYQITRDIGSKDQLVQHLWLKEKIETILDVGANQGQYGHLLRHLGWRGRIASFEPGSEAFSILKRVASHDKDWIPVNLALGARAGVSQLHVARNSVSSSLLTVSDLHIVTEKESAELTSEEVALSTVDEQVSRLGGKPPFWLKLDVQGYEMTVLDGASSTLPHTAVIECEMSFRPLYHGGADYRDLLSRLSEAGFTPLWFEPAFVDQRSGEMMQVDAILARR